MDSNLWGGGGPWGGGDIFGSDPTLPTCGYQKVVCGSSLPGYPPPMCWIYCCTWPNGFNNCSII
jgi:hypothetical protein